MFNTYNPDVLRMWVLLSDYKNDVVLSDDSMNSSSKQYFKLRNFLRYLLNNIYLPKHNYDLVDDGLKTKVESLNMTIAKCVDEFDINKAFRNVIQFLNNYSATLTEDKKNEFYEAELDSDVRLSQESEFHYIVSEFITIMFPFLPFLSIELETELNKL